jgi:hypothetical protein
MERIKIIPTAIRTITASSMQESFFTQGFTPRSIALGRGLTYTTPSLEETGGVVKVSPLYLC